MSRLVLTSYKNRLVNSQKPSSIMQRPGKQLAIQQIAIALQQQQYQQYMRKPDFILQNTDPIVFNEEPEVIHEEPEVIHEEPEVIHEEPAVIHEEPAVIEELVKLTITHIDNREITENNNIYTELLNKNTNEIQETVLPIKNKKKKFNTDKINTIVETEKQEPFKASRKNMIEKALSTLITKFMISRQ